MSSIKSRYGMEFIDMRMADKDSIANYVLIRQMDMIRNRASYSEGNK